MGSTTGHRRTASKKAKAVGAVAVAVLIGGAAFAFTGTAQAAAVGAVYTKSSSWSGGYTAQYVITNGKGQAQQGWTLEFDLPAGTKIDSLWNGTHSVNGRHVTVKPAEWNGELAAGASVTIGFVASGSGTPGNPTACRINGAKCSADQGTTPPPGGRPTGTPTAVPSTGASPSASAPATTAPSAQPTRTASPSATATPPPATGAPAGERASPRTWTPPCTRPTTWSTPRRRPA